LGDAGVFSSTNGTTWRTNTLQLRTAFDLAYGAGRFVATGDGTYIWVSTNAVNWSRITTDSPYPLSRVAYETNRFIATGENGVTAISTNGLDWETHHNGAPPYFQQVAFGHGRMAAIGAWPSSSPLTIAKDPSAWQSLFPRYRFSTVTFAGNQFIAFGSDPNTNPPQYVVANSADGIAWRTRSYLPGSFPTKILHAQGTYVGIGDYFFASPDGVTWTITGAPQYTPLLGLAYGNNTFVAVRNMRVYTSTTGTNWVTNLVTGFELRDVAYGNNTFAAVGFHDVGGPNIFAVSSDGIHWTTNSLPQLPDRERFVHLTYGGGWFAAWGASGHILSSPDGVSWTLHQPAPGKSIISLAYDRGRFIAATQTGTFLETRILPEIEIAAADLPSRALRLSLRGKPSQVFAIQSTPSLSPPLWTEVRRLTNSTPASTFTEEIASDPARFYRLVERP
jgi:hypothetical protein